LVERGQLCGEASGANLGWLTVSTKPPGVLFELARLSQRLYADFNERIDRRAYVQRSGSLICCLSETELAARENRTRQQAALGVDVRMLTPAKARTLEPILPARFLGASYCPEDGLIYPFPAVFGFARAAARLGARIYTDTPAVAVQRHGGAV